MAPLFPIATKAALIVLASSFNPLVHNVMPRKEKISSQRRLLSSKIGSTEHCPSRLTLRIKSASYLYVTTLQGIDDTFPDVPAPQLCLTFGELFSHVWVIIRLSIHFFYGLYVHGTRFHIILVAEDIQLIMASCKCRNMKIKPPASTQYSLPGKRNSLWLHVSIFPLVSLHDALTHNSVPPFVEYSATSGRPVI